MMEDYKDEDVLRKLYLEDELSLPTIADKFSISYGTIHYYMEKFGIERRGKSESVSLGHHQEAPYRNQDWLESKLEERGCVSLVAEEAGCSSPTVREWCEKFDIPMPDGRISGDGLHTDRNWLEERWYSGKSNKEIATEAGCSEQQIEYWGEEFGFPLKRQVNSYPLSDEEWLKDRWYSDMTCKEIAEEAGTNHQRVSYYRKKFGFPPKKRMDRPWQDEEILRELYEDGGMSTRQISEEFDISPSTVLKWLNENDIETTDRSILKSVDNISPGIHTNREGYEVFVVDDGGVLRAVSLHRLNSLVDYPIEDIKGKHIHHKNRVPWDNRMDNLEPLWPSEHMSHHWDEGII